jgi:hypothetical protein
MCMGPYPKLHEDKYPVQLRKSVRMLESRLLCSAAVKHNADFVESCTLSESRLHGTVACGTYELEETSKSRMGGLHFFRPRST